MSRRFGLHAGRGLHRASDQAPKRRFAPVYEVGHSDYKDPVTDSATKGGSQALDHHLFWSIRPDKLTPRGNSGAGHGAIQC